MRAYHYTTWEAYQFIRAEGLKLSLLEERHKAGCREVLHLVERGCVWVYPEAMRDRKLVGMVVYVACRHDSNHIVGLEVEYPEVHSATWLVERAFDDPELSIRLRHTLDFTVIDRPSPFGHWEVFDLVAEPISPSDIRLVGEWDLLSFIQAGLVELGEKVAA